MLVLSVGVGHPRPLLPFLPPERWQCAAEANLRHVSPLDGSREPAPPDAVERPGATHVHACTRRPHVLIIEDSAGALYTIARGLRHEGLRVSEAPSGAAGLALARGGALDAVVADQCLPDLTGLEVLAQLRAMGSRVPVVMMSGWATPERSARAEELGAFVFLQKPVLLDELLQAIQRAFQTEPPAVEPEVVGRAEPPSQAMSEIRHLAAGLVEQDTPTAMAVTHANVAVEARRRLLYELVQVVVCPHLSVRELLRVAAAICQVVHAPDHLSSSELARTVLDALCRAGLGEVRRPSHAKVVEALAHLASLEGPELQLSERDLADAVGMGLSRLSRLLHPQTGLDLRQWKRGFRMRQAVQHLAGTDKDVSEISAWLGCKHASQFDHEFHDLFRLTPREFRKILRSSAASC